MNVLTKSRNIIKSTVVAGSAFALIAAPTTAFAHGSSGNGGDNNRSQTKTSQQQKNKNSGDNSRAQAYARYKANKQKTCEERQASLNQRAADSQSRSQKKLNGLNIVYSGIQTYVSSGEVTINNYDALNANATASQANATAAVNALVAPQLNCDDDSSNSSNSANAELNSKINAVRQSLKGYSKDVTVLFRAAIES